MRFVKIYAHPFEIGFRKGKALLMFCVFGEFVYYLLTVRLKRLIKYIFAPGKVSFPGAWFKW